MKLVSFVSRDISKAYYSLPHDLLLAKPEAYGFDATVKQLSDIDTQNSLSILISNVAHGRLSHRLYHKVPY